MTDHVELRPGQYADSVALMLATREVSGCEGVEAALVAMATPLNLDLLRGLGFDPPPGASPDDLVVAVRVNDGGPLEGALACLEASLRPGSRPASATTETPPPRTVGEAARHAVRRPGVALISVPGAHAFVEAMDAIEHGLHPMVFSDNVSVEQEVLLKQRAAERGLLVMGPDCGTVILSGVGLGFSNVVKPGPVGIVAASGTGAQQLCCLLDDGGIGVRHVLGVGGRDVTEAVAGRSTLAALEALDADPGVEVVVVVSKPPAPMVAAAIDQAAAGARTPVLTCFIGMPAQDLTATAAAVAEHLGGTLPPPRDWPALVPERPAPGRQAGHLRGLFAGGTLCAEATTIAGRTLGPLGSEPDGDGHVAVDLGDDRYTAGRPHPMIDQSLRISRILAEAQRPGDHVLLLDVVLGHGAHADPAAELAPAISHARQDAAARGDHLAVVVSLCGTADDPQDREAQAARLQQAGAAVYTSNAAAARAAVALVGATR